MLLIIMENSSGKKNMDWSGMRITQELFHQCCLAITSAKSFIVPGSGNSGCRPQEKYLNKFLI